MRPVRVCFLIDELNMAGTETQLLALIRQLDRSRVQPHLCLLRGQSEISRSLEPSDCPVLRLEVGSLRSPATLPKLWRLRNFLRQKRIDVLQVYFPDSTYAGVPLGWLAGVPAIVRTRNNVGHWLTPLHRWLGRILNNFTTVTIANCDAARQSLVKAEKTRRVIVLENGVDLSRFAGIPPLQPADLWAGVQVGTVANLRPVKGLDLLVEAAVILRDRGRRIRFVVAGEGSERHNLSRLIETRGLTSRFHLFGSCNDVPGFLARCSIAVLTSRAEGMSNAVLEYMAAGRAIVATDVGNNARVVRHGIDGLIVPPNDAHAIAGALFSLLDNPELACSMAASARARAAEVYSREAMVRRFEDFYQQLLPGKVNKPVVA